MCEGKKKRNKRKQNKTKQKLVSALLDSGPSGCKGNQKNIRGGGGGGEY